MPDAEKQAERKARRAALKAKLGDAVSDWREEHSIDADEGAQLRAQLLDVLWVAVPILADGDVDEDDEPQLRKLFAELDELKDIALNALAD
jgi:hypothetical protein